ncbi:MAG: hypothetical protein R6X11_11340, partial [Desulfonatronovibrio sp.]
GQPRCPGTGISRPGGSLAPGASVMKELLPWLRPFAFLRSAVMQKDLAPGGELIIHSPRLGGYEY